VFTRVAVNGEKPEDVDYVLDGGAYLNFTDLPETEAMKLEAGTRIH